MEHLTIDWTQYAAAVWRSNQKKLKPIRDIDSISFEQLIGINKQIEQISKNTEALIAGEKANHALLWGARGTGKSSIIKGLLNQYYHQGLRVIEIPKDDLVYLLDICDSIRDLKYHFIVFCDDLSFDEGEVAYKALKSALEGTIEAPPRNMLVYATSNRRHLISEKMSDNLSSELVDGEIHQGDVLEEKMSLSDRFGLLLSFYPINQSTYLEMVDSHFKDFDGNKKQLHQLAIRYASQKGARSGRVAKQFANYYRLG